MKEIFTKPPIWAFKRNKNLKDIIGGNKVFDNKKILNVKKSNKEKCHFMRSINLCCKQLKPAQPFKEPLTKNPF